jgi:hypothetical protein
MPRKMWAFAFKCPSCSDSQSLTSKSLYNWVPNVIDLTCRYYIGAEYLECLSCRGTLISYDARLLTQLTDSYQVRFPVTLTRKYACNSSVINLMHARTLGNSPTTACHDVHEMQAEECMRRTIFYLADCDRHKKVGSSLICHRVNMTTNHLISNRPKTQSDSKLRIFVMFVNYCRC